MYKFYDFYFYAELAYSGPDPYYFNWKLFKKNKKNYVPVFSVCILCTLYSVYVGGIRIRVGQLSDPDPHYFNLDPHYFNLDPHHWIF